MFAERTGAPRLSLFLLAKLTSNKDKNFNLDDYTVPSSTLSTSTSKSTTTEPLYTATTLMLYDLTPSAAAILSEKAVAPPSR